jgi:ribosome-associated translation inhibitor RaiA
MVLIRKSQLFAGDFKMAVPVFDNVEFIKFPDIDEADQIILDKSLVSFFKKVPEGKLHLTHKSYNKGGLKTQHEVHGRFIVKGKEFFASVVSWEFLDSIQKVLDKLEREVRKLHSQK